MDRFRVDTSPASLGLPARESLEALERRIPGLDREELVAGARGVRAEILDALRLEHARGAGGVATSRALSDGIDRLVTLLFRHACARAPDGVPDLALFAMGGYGRREMAPQSDVDLLFLSESPAAEPVEEAAKTLIQLLWDSGFVLGHTLHSMEELPRIPSADTDFKSALLESRFLCGSQGVGDRLEAVLAGIASSERPAFLEAKIEDTLRRHARFGGSYLLIEPNVKSSPGGLRDLHTILWMGAVLPWGGSLEAWGERGLLDEAEIEEFQASYDFLLRVRHEIHYRTGRKRDVLDLALQREVAAGLGYEASGHASAVERFMKDYYSRNRFVFQFTIDLFHEVVVSEILSGGKGPPDRDLGGGLVLRAGRLDGDVDGKRLAEDPLYVFKEQQRLKVRLSRGLRRVLGRALRKAVADPDRLAVMRRGLYDIFSTGVRLGGIVRRIHDLDLLVPLIPEFADLVGLKKHDLYHQYTADEHSIKVLENLDDLARGRSGNPELEVLYGALPDRLSLHLAALLHDVGKGREGNHSQVGAVMTEAIVRRLGGSQETARRAAGLVRHHILMSHTSQRRDARDPATVDRFLETIEDVHDLTRLYLLTYADMKATSPAVWTEWKGALLRELYLRAHAVMEGVPRDQVFGTERRRGDLAGRLEDLGEEARRHLDLLPDRYQAIYSAAEVRHHLGMIRELERRDVVVRFERHGPWTRLEVYTRDRPARLSQICGALTVNDLDIHGAQVFTREDGVVLDSFLVSPVEGGAPLDRPRQNKIARDVESILRGDLDPDREIERHAHRWRRRVETAIRHPVTVRFEEDPSGRFTIIDVSAHDRPGLLYRITRIFARLGCDIHLAFISTQANKVVDGFYVTMGEGEGGEGAPEEIERALIEGLEG